MTIDDKPFSEAKICKDEWNILKPFFNKVILNHSETIIIITHKD